MPTFDIVKTLDIDKTYRVSRVLSDFDLKLEHGNEHFKGSLNLSDDWKIGLIVGSSGSGKSTIANALYPDDIVKGFDYTAKSVIDDMPDKGFSEITKMFYAVGFGSVPCWIKPYHVLSNGEKMRVDMARALLEHDTIVFDEFTSVVDRNVARTLSMAVNKAVHRENKRFIAVTCHFDVIDWLCPDWIFNTDTMTFYEYDKEREKKTSPSEDVNDRNGRSLGVITI